MHCVPVVLHSLTKRLLCCLQGMKAQNEILTTAAATEAKAATQAKECLQASEANAKLHADKAAVVSSICGPMYAFSA